MGVDYSGADVMFKWIRQLFYITPDEIKELSLVQKYEGLARSVDNNDEKGAGLYLHEIVVERADTIMHEMETEGKFKRKKKKK